MPNTVLWDFIRIRTATGSPNTFNVKLVHLPGPPTAGPRLASGQLPELDVALRPLALSMCTRTACAGWIYRSQLDLL